MRLGTRFGSGAEFDMGGDDEEPVDTKSALASAADCSMFSFSGDEEEPHVDPLRSNQGGWQLEASAARGVLGSFTTPAQRAMSFRSLTSSG